MREGLHKMRKWSDRWRGRKEASPAGPQFNKGSSANTMHKSPPPYLDRIRARNPNEPEFLQAVEEVVTSIDPLVMGSPAYQRARVIERLTEPDRIITFPIVWQTDDGAVQINRGWRVQFSNLLGPYKGGLRFTPGLSLSVLKFLGFEQIFKNALTGLPLGGGKGGADFDPKGKSDDEIMRFCQAFMTELHHHIGHYVDVPAGDIGVGARELGYLYGQHKRLTNQVTGALTGKGLGFGGSEIRKEATGYGAVYFVSDMLEHHNEGLEDKRVLVSGAGNVALYAAEMAIMRGAKVETLSDSGGFIHQPGGFSQDQLQEIKEMKEVRRLRLADVAEAQRSLKFLASKKPWGVEADIALPCATQNEVELSDAKQMVGNGIGLIAEGANMPVRNDAIAFLKEAGILFGPAKAANAGGVAVSGLEQTQNAMRKPWTREDVDRELQSIMARIHDTCIAHGGGASKSLVDYQHGANVGAFKIVADAMLAQGIY